MKKEDYDIVADRVDKRIEANKEHDVSTKKRTEGVCRVCGCTDEDCSQCIKKTGRPCYWVEPDLCSACANEGDKNGIR